MTVTGQIKFRGIEGWTWTCFINARDVGSCILYLDTQGRGKNMFEIEEDYLWNMLGMRGKNS